MKKEALRKIYKTKRKSLSKLEIENQSIKILEHLQSLKIWSYSTYHIFLPIEPQNEVNTMPIIDFLFLNKKTVVFPKIKGKNLLNCKVKSNYSLKKNSFNILEPIDFEVIDSSFINVVFIPLLICDVKGNRIGYGGGFYDRFLSSCSENVVKIGLNFFPSVPLIEDIFESDVPINYCVTPLGIESF